MSYFRPKMFSEGGVCTLENADNINICYPFLHSKRISETSTADFKVFKDTFNSFIKKFYLDNHLMYFQITELLSFSQWHLFRQYNFSMHNCLPLYYSYIYSLKLYFFKFHILISFFIEPFLIWSQILFHLFINFRISTIKNFIVIFRICCS